MKTVTLHADWQPKPDFKLGAKDIDGKLTYFTWLNPMMMVISGIRGLLLFRRH
jgi:hypothetical protein